MNLNSASLEHSMERSINSSAAIAKQPVRKLEFAINRIAKVVALHLKMLRDQKSNIEKFKQTEQWDKLHSELINASRTVQQLKADIYELEIVGEQVIDEEHYKFEVEAAKTRGEILREIACFMELHGSALKPGPFTTTGEEPDYSTSSIEHYPYKNDKQLTLSLDHGLDQSHRANGALRSWTHLNQELVDLRSLVASFANIVRSHKPVLDNIESNVDNAHANVHEATSHLSKAAKLKLAMLPMTGAVVGGLLGGPVGLVAGYKVGGLACLAGGSLGFMGVRFLERRKKRQSEDLELSDLKMPLRKTASLDNVQ